MRTIRPITRRRDSIVAMAERTRRAAHLRQQCAIPHRPDGRPCLAAIAVPTLSVAGDSERQTPPEHGAEIAGCHAALL